jgi:4-hydroxyphenylpyruvate dioxygenase
MKTCIATVSIPGNFREKIFAIADAGFDAIELFEPDLVTHGCNPRDVGNMIRDHGLDIAILQPFRDFEGWTGPMRLKAFEEAERKFDLMGELGTDLVLLCSSVAVESLGETARVVEDFTMLGDLAAKRCIRVGFEALAWGRHIRDVAQAWDVVNQCNHPNIGLIVDSFHTLVRKNDPDEIRSIPGDRIFFVQIADAPAIEMDVLQLSRQHRMLPGEGDLDVDAVVSAVLAAGYTGPMSLEIFRSSFPPDSSQLVAGGSYRALVNLVNRARLIKMGGMAI